MNSIWECKIYLQMPNPKRSHKEPFLKGNCTCLVILDENKERADLITNNNIIQKTITREIGGKFKVEHIVDCIPIKNLGKSLATF